MLHFSPPKDFRPKFEVSGCFVECTGNILLLLRQGHKSEPNTYGCPAGKVSPWETPEEAARREIFEETGIRAEPVFFKTAYVRYSWYDFVYHMFSWKSDALPEVVLNLEEHAAYVWKTPEEALEMPLIQDLDECIRTYFYP